MKKLKIKILLLFLIMTPIFSVSFVYASPGGICQTNGSQEPRELEKKLQIEKEKPEEERDKNRINILENLVNAKNILLEKLSTKDYQFIDKDEQQVNKLIEPHGSFRLSNRHRILIKRLEKNMKIISYGKFTVENNAISEEFYSISGQIKINEDETNIAKKQHFSNLYQEQGIFTTTKEIVANDGGQNAIQRDSDAEYKILEHVARITAPNPKTKGELEIFISAPSCTSCQGVFEQFKSERPYITVTKHELPLPPIRFREPTFEQNQSAESLLTPPASTSGAGENLREGTAA
jgi:hypothetical protein